MQQNLPRAIEKMRDRDEKTKQNEDQIDVRLEICFYYYTTKEITEWFPMKSIGDIITPYDSGACGEDNANEKKQHTR